MNVPVVETLLSTTLSNGQCRMVRPTILHMPLLLPNETIQKIPYQVCRRFSLRAAFHRCSPYQFRMHCSRYQPLFT